jgi:uncharacterized membrane protein
MRTRTLAILLGLSLVLNVFVIGAVVGLFFGPAIGAPPTPPQPRPNPMMAAADRLDPADRDVFRALMQDEVQRQGPTALDARLARRQAAELMRQPTFDRAAAGVALDRARADDATVRRAVEDAMLDFAARLDQRGRTTLADGLGRSPGWLARRAAASAQPPASRPPR